jgi:predicted dehydrogenase
VTTALIVGGGSIALRHGRVLQGLGAGVSFVSSRTDLDGVVYPTVDAAISSGMPDYVVVANDTSRHAEAVSQLTQAGYTGRLLIEKPAVVDPQHTASFSLVGVAFNLRFHPVIARLREVLSAMPVDEHVIQVEAYAGQWLPDWRPDRPVNEQYSAHVARGGGVLRDLSHELDLVQWLIGKATGVFARGGRIGDVTVDSDDSWNVVLEHTNRATTSVQLNYFDRPGARFLRVVTSHRTFEASLTSSTLSINGDGQSFAIERDDTYRSMHEDMLGAQATVATITAASETDALILDIELSAKTKKWIER